MAALNQPPPRIDDLAGRLVSALLALTVVGLPIVILSLLIFLPAVLALQSAAVIDRFTDPSSDVSTKERLTFQADTLQLSLENPLLGSAFSESSSVRDPHNIISEAFMVLVAVRPCLFMPVCARVALKSVAQFRNW